MERRVERVNPWTRRAALLWRRMQRPFLRRRIGRHSLEWIEGRPFLVLPGVHNPFVFHGGPLLARTIPPPRPGPPTEPRALDMGTGSGVCAVFAALSGYRVLGIDLFGEAARCARINALLNRVEDRVEVREGDLFEPLEPGEKFDLVLFNPPFFRGRPRDGQDMAWRSPDVFERFAAGLPEALRRGGRGLLLLSSDGEAEAMLNALDHAGFAATPTARRHLGHEIMTVYCVGRRGAEVGETE